MLRKGSSAIAQIIEQKSEFSNSYRSSKKNAIDHFLISFFIDYQSSLSISIDNPKHCIYGCPYCRLENWIQIVWQQDMLLEFTESEMLKDPRILMTSLLGQEMRWPQS